ncbi:MAG: hypothetical protein RMJ48_17130 [Roseiflexaceae bacterium]|nr:hypothetical protein [Roseiflexaceae bacterium]
MTMHVLIPCLEGVGQKSLLLVTGSIALYSMLAYRLMLTVILACKIWAECADCLTAGCIPA